MQSNLDFTPELHHILVRHGISRGEMLTSDLLGWAKEIAAFETRMAQNYSGKTARELKKLVGELDGITSLVFNENEEGELGPLEWNFLRKLAEVIEKVEEMSASIPPPRP